MNKKKCFKQAVGYALIVAMLVIIMIPFTPANICLAATANVSVGSASGEVGSEVSLSITISSSEDIAATQVQLVYDKNVVEAVSGFDTGGNGVINWIDTDTFKNKTRTVVFKILSAGTANVSVGSGTNIAGFDGYMTLQNSAGTITGTAPVNYSTNNNLASLQISPGVLSPAFSTNITSYTTSVEKDVDRLVINAIPEDDTATITVGGANLDPGSNVTTITVTAQDGSRKVYTIYTTRGEAEEETKDEKKEDFEDVELTVGGTKYKLKSNLSDHPLPSGYSENDYDLDGKKVKTGVGANTKLVLVYLEAVDASGVSGFYIYDSVAKSYTLYNEVAEPNITYCILDITDTMEKPDNYTLMDYSLSGKNVKVMMNQDRTYCLFYGISSQGVKGWFRYCIADETIQVFDGNQDGVSFTKIENESKKEDKPIDSYKSWFYVMGAVAVVLLVALVLVIVFMNKKLSVAKKAFSRALVDSDDDEAEDEELELFEVDED